MTEECITYGGNEGFISCKQFCRWIYCVIDGFVYKTSEQRRKSQDELLSFRAFGQKEENTEPQREMDCRSEIYSSSWPPRGDSWLHKQVWLYESMKGNYSIFHLINYHNKHVSNEFTQSLHHNVHCGNYGPNIRFALWCGFLGPTRACPLILGHTLKCKYGHCCL